MATVLCRSRSVSSFGRWLHCLLWAAAVVSAAAVYAGEAKPPAASSQPGAAASPSLIVGNLAGETSTISAKEFASLPRVTFQTKAPHSDETATYEGVLLGHVLQDAGIEPRNKAQPEKKEMDRPLRSAYVLIEAADGYQVVFSLAEVFPESGGPNVLLADRKNGKPVDAKAGPYQVVVRGSTMYERWVRQVRRILVRPGSASPFASEKKPAAPPAAKDSPRAGFYLVGVGPGAPDLITVRAAAVLQKADLVLCYSWMKDELAPLVRPGVVEVASPLLQGGRYFGQKPADLSGAERERATAAHEELAKLKARIQKMLKAGKTVAIADNGDPMVFSPWSWVPEQLAELNPTVVPGLTSFSAGNAALKRSVAAQDSVILSSGSDLGTPNEKGRLAGAVVFYTHRTKFDAILPKLRQRYPADTPVAIVCDASCPPEKVIFGTLETIADVLAGKKLPHLYLVYVGDGLKQGACWR